MLQKGGLFLFGFLFGKCDPIAPNPQPPPIAGPVHDGYGADTNTTGNPIGGGTGYTAIVDAQDPVSTLADLELRLADSEVSVRAAIAAGTDIPTHLIYIADDATIDAGSDVLNVAPGVTIASGRGRTQGALIQTLIDGTQTLFHVLSADDLDSTTPLPPTRITGLRLQGPDADIIAPDCFSWGRKGIDASRAGTRNDETRIQDQHIEIDNNELFAFTEAINVEGLRGLHVHHNHIHHNRRNAHTLECALQLEFHAAGYGVDINSGHALIEANLFEFNRHAIASHGDPFTVYEAYYNVVQGDNISHSFDMHGGVDRDDGTYIAGDTMIIAFNSLLDKDHDAVNVRGYPQTGAWVFQNIVINGPDTIMQTKIPIGELKRMFVFDNKQP